MGLSSGRPISNRRALLAGRGPHIAVLIAVAVMFLATVAPMTSGDPATSANGWSDVWTCTISVGDGGKIVTKYAENGAELGDTDPVKGNNGSASTGSWGFDEVTGYGPFGSYYAAFDVSTGKICKHLKPSDLSKALDGTDVDATGYNIMWVLPTVWMSLGDDGTLTLSSEASDGATAPAHTIDGKVYNYLAIGVYEGYVKDSKVYSFPGQWPTVSVSMGNFQTYAGNTGAGEGGHSMLWNFYQWQLYRFCSLAVMENFDSQEQIGYGNSSGTRQQTGSTIGEGPYYGTTGQSSRGERLFIENAWGNVWDFVGDTYWSGGLYAGQNSKQVSDQRLVQPGNKTNLVSGMEGSGISPDTSHLDSWGLPTAVGAGGIDFIRSDESGYSLIVGGPWDYGANSGLTCIDRGFLGGFSNDGSRLAMVFDADPVAIHHATFDTAGGEGAFPTLDLHQGDRFAMPSAPIKAGFVFEGWSDGNETYASGTEVTMGAKSMALRALWAEAPTHRVSYASGEGSGDAPPDQYVPEGVEFTVSSVIPVRAGYGFVGWSDGHAMHGPGEVMTMGGSDIALIAVWSVNIFPIFPDQEETIEVIVPEDSEPWIDRNGKTVVLIAIIVAIIAELAVLSISRKR